MKSDIISLCRSDTATGLSTSLVIVGGEDCFSKVRGGGKSDQSNSILSNPPSLSSQSLIISLRRSVNLDADDRKSFRSDVFFCGLPLRRLLLLPLNDGELAEEPLLRVEEKLRSTSKDADDDAASPLSRIHI